MNKSALYITLSIVLLASAGLFVYDRYFTGPEQTLWDMVPKSSSLVYEPETGVDSWYKLKENDIWQILNSFEPLQRVDAFITDIDSTQDASKFNSAFSDARFLITLNPVSGSSCDFLFLVEKSRLSDRVIKSVLDSLEQTHSVSKRNFNGFEVVEMKKGKSDVIFTYSNSDFGWFGSFSPVLVEDVIRLLSSDVPSNYMVNNPEPFYTTRIRNDAGNFYFNYDQLGDLYSTFLDPSNRSAKKRVETFGKNGFFDIAIQPGQVVLNGFSYYNEPSQFLSGLNASAPRSSIIEQYIPSKTAFCVNMNITQLDSSAQFQSFNATLDGEFAVSVLESQKMDQSEKVYYLRSNNIEASIEELTRVAEAVQLENQDTLYFESYSDYTIYELNIPSFINQYSDFTFGSPEFYFFTAVNQYLVFATSIESLKNFINDIESENTWGKSVKKNKFLESTLQETNFSLYIDINKSWNYIIESAHPDWIAHLKENEVRYRKLELMALQFSNTDQKMYSSLVLGYNPEFQEVFARRRNVSPDHQAQLKAAIVTPPKVVRNHINNQREVIIQDDSLRVSLIGSTGSVLWQRRLSGKIVDEIQQIDYFKNGKLQYLMAYDSTLLLIDRNGDVVSGFPKKMSYKIDKFNVIDYDKSKNYRFILADVRGNVFMYDKEGKNLEGWNPFFSNGRLATAPQHLRVRGRDIILLQQQNGKFFLLNRRAEVYPGFPVDLGPNVNVEYAVHFGSNFSNSTFTFLSKRGVLTRINMEGKILNQQQMLSTLNSPEYYLIPERLGKGYLVGAKDVGSIQVIDESNQILFEKQLISAKPYDFQYYDFGTNRQIVVVTDSEQEFSYLYKMDGELINNSPIDSKFPVGVLFSEAFNQYKIYTAYDTKVNIYSF